MTYPPLVSLHHVVCTHRGTPAPALDDVSLDIHVGVRLALIGPNGAGKSTLLSLLNGSRRPARGTLHRDGLPARYDRRALVAWRREIGLVWQDPDDQLFAPTVLQDVAFGPLNQGLPAAEAQARAVAALEQLGAAALGDRPIHALSLGQKKRVAIAGIVAMQPRMLVLDEPTAGLDPLGAAALMQLLDGLHRTGTTIVIAAVEPDPLWGWADEVAVLRDGRLTAHGPALAMLADGRLFDDVPRRPALLEVAMRLRRNGGVPANLPLPPCLNAALQEVEHLALRRALPAEIS